MIFFDDIWGGFDYVQDTPPAEGLSISYWPGTVSDTGSVQPHLESEATTRSFMQHQYRIASENMAEAGLVISIQG